MGEKERLDLERRVSAAIMAGRTLHLFSGLGIHKLLNYLVCHEKLSIAVSCEPVKQKGGLVTGGSFLVGVFNGYEQRGYYESADFHEAVTVAAAQALDILPQVGKKILFGRKPRGDETGATDV